MGSSLCTEQHVEDRLGGTVNQYMKSCLSKCDSGGDCDCSPDRDAPRTGELSELSPLEVEAGSDEECPVGPPVEVHSVNSSITAWKKRYGHDVVHVESPKPQLQFPLPETCLLARRGSDSRWPITLIVRADERDLRVLKPSFKKIAAMFHVNRNFTKVTIIPRNNSYASTTTIPMSHVKAIERTESFAPYLCENISKVNGSNFELSAVEKERAIMLQYLDNDRLVRCMVFLDMSGRAKDHFILSLISKWMAKRKGPWTSS